MTPQDPLPGFSLAQADSLASQLNSMTEASKQPEPEVAAAPTPQADPHILTADQYKADVATMTLRAKDTENPVTFLRAVKENPKITEGIRPDSAKLFTDSMETGLLPDIKKVYGLDDEAAKQKLYADPTMVDYGHELVRSIIPASERGAISSVRGLLTFSDNEDEMALRNTLTNWYGVSPDKLPEAVASVYKAVGDASQQAKEANKEYHMGAANDLEKTLNDLPVPAALGGRGSFSATFPGGGGTTLGDVAAAAYRSRNDRPLIAQLSEESKRSEKDNPEDPRMAGGKAEAFIQGAAGMPIGIVQSLVPGIREATNFGQLYDQAYEQAQQVAKEKGQTLSEDDLHATATTAALINLPTAEIASLVMLKGAGKLLPAPLASKISAFARANPKLSALGTLTSKAVTQGVAQLAQNTVTNVVTGADAGRGAENAFVGGVGGGMAATVIVDGIKDGGRAIARKLSLGDVPNTPTGVAAPGATGDPNAVSGSNGKVVDVTSEVVPTGPAEVDPGLTGRVKSAFDNLDNNDKFTPEQKATAKAKIMGMLTPEEHSVVDAALNPKPVAEATPVTGATPPVAAAAPATPVAPPAVAAHGETTTKVLQMVDIEHTLGLNDDQKGKMQGEILASMPPEKQQAVIDLFQQAHNNAAELDRIRSVAPETAAALGPEFQARLGTIIDKLHSLDPKPAAEPAPVAAVEPTQITPVVRAEIEHGLTEAPEHTTEPTAVDLAIGAAAAPNMTPSGYAKSKPFRAELTNFLTNNPAGNRKDLDLPGLAATFHQQALNAAVSKGRAVNAWAMEAYGLPTPEGYVPEGKQLVHNPDKAAQLKAAAAPEQPNTAIAEVPAPTPANEEAKQIQVQEQSPSEGQGQGPSKGDATLAEQGQGPSKGLLTPAPKPTTKAPKKAGVTPEQRVVAPSDHLEPVKGEEDAPASPEEAIVEKSAPDSVREEGKVWKDGTVQAFANAKTLAEYFRSQGDTPGEASRKTLALVKERKTQGREINAPDSFDAKRVASLYAAALSASHSGTGFNLDKLTHLLDKMRDHLTRNEGETGNPETRIKKATGEVTPVAWKGPLGLVSRDAQNYNKNMGTGGTKVALHVLDGEHGASGDSADAYQMQGNEVAHNEATPAADRAVVAAGAHSADFHGNPRQALEAKERGDMRKRLHGVVNTRIGDFITNMAASGNFGSREDIEAATFKMALKAFPAKLVDVPVDKNGRVKGGRPSPGVSELMEDEDFRAEFIDLRKDIGETIVRDFGDSRPSLSQHAITPSDLTAEDVAHGLRGSTESLGEIGKNVMVVQSEADLPQHVRDSIDRNSQQGRVKGMYDPATHDIYLVADAHQNVEEAERTLLHEAIGEHGLDQVLPAHDWAAVREALLSDPEAAKVSDTYKGKQLSDLTESEKDTVARETFARMAEEPTFKPSLWDKIVNLINTAFRKMGFAVKYGAAELRSMVQQARNAVSRGTVEPQSLQQKMESMSPSEALQYVKEQTGRDPIAESFDRVTRQRFAEDYGLADGVDGLMKAVTEKETDPVIRALAEALVGRAPQNTRITLNPELALRGLGGRFLARQNSIELDPSRGGLGLHRTMVEEVMHSAIFDKLRSFSTGDDTNLSAEDQSNLLALSTVYGEVLQNHAPAEVLALATDPTLNAIARNNAFVDLTREKPELAPWYRALSMDEFVAGALTDGEFQKRLSAIARVDGGDNTVKPSGNSLFARVRELFTKLVTGGREDTALHQTTDNSLSLIERANGADRMTEPGSEIVTAYDPELGSLKDVFDGIGHLLSTAHEVYKGRDELGKACIRIFADRMNDLREAELFMAKRRGLANLPDGESAHLASENYHGKVPYRLEQMEKNYITPIHDLLTKIKAKGGSIDDANQWLYASHARERNMHVASINTMFPDGGSGMTTADAQGHLTRLGNGPFGAELRQISALVQKMGAEDLANHESYGLMTPELRQILTNKYANYISLQGKEGDHVDEAEGIFPSLGKGFDIRGSEPKRALGRSTMATNVLANTFEQFGRNIIRQEKNYVLQRLAELVDKNPDPAFWERPKPTMEPYFDKAASKVKTRETHGYLRDEKVIAYKEAGVIKYLDIKHDGLRRNIKNAGLASNSLLEKVFFGGIGTLNRIKAATVTKYSVDFIVSNLFRDIGEASMNLTSPEMTKVKGQIRKDMLTFKALGGAHEGIMHPTSTNPWAVSYRELAKAGGLIEYYGLNDLKNDIAHAVGALKKTPISDGAHWVADHTGISAVGKFMSTYGSVVETSTRLAVYHNLRKSGVSIDRAAHAARTITVNFNRKGEMGPIINTLYLFANANIQSNVSMIRSLKQRGAKGAAQVILGGMTLGAVMGAYNRMAGGVDEKTGLDRYDSIPDHVRHSNIVAMVPESIRKGVQGIPGVVHLLGDDGRYISFPMPYGYNTLVSSGTTIEKFYAGKMTAAHAVGDIFSGLADAFNPLGGMGSLTQMITPTALRPVVDINTNKKFDGTPMYPDDSPSGGKLPDSTKYFRSASAPAVALTKKVNELFGGNDFHSGSLGPVDMSVSPATVDYMTGFVFGSVGDTIKRIGSIGMKAATGDTSKIQANEIPVARRFVGGETDVVSRQAYQYIVDASKVAMGEVKTDGKMGRAEDFQGAATSQLPELQISAMVKQIGKARMQLAQRRALLNDEGNKTEPTAKKAALDWIDDTDLALQKEVVKQYVKLKKAQIEAEQKKDQKGTRQKGDLKPRNLTLDMEQ